MLIFRLLVTVAGLLALSLAVLMAREVIKKPTSPLFVAVVVYAMLAYVFLYLSARLIREYIIHPDKLEVRILFGLVKHQYEFRQLHGYKLIPFINKIGTYRAIGIQTPNKGFIHITEFDIKNYDTLEKVIKERTYLNTTLEEPEWIMGYVLLIGAVILILIRYIIIETLK